jgi:hypothetical protein
MCERNNGLWEQSVVERAGRIGKKIDKVDEQGMRKIGGHFRTASGKAIAVENDILPARHRYDSRFKRIAIKSLGKKKDNPMRKLVEKEKGGKRKTKTKSRNKEGKKERKKQKGDGKEEWREL